MRTDYGVELLKYERYVPQASDYLEDNQLISGGFSCVIATSVFEHLRFREEFEEINRLVGRKGVLGIHTLVSEAVPQDPSWFYLVPVHSTFHTNKSMQMLFEQWDYTCSVYSVEAQLWLWLRDAPERVALIVTEANSRPLGPFYVYKQGFVDYWKTAPYRSAETSGKIA